MTENERRILLLFEKTLPQMTQQEQERLLYYGEGMAAMLEQRSGEKQQRRAES